MSEAALSGGAGVATYHSSDLRTRANEGHCRPVATFYRLFGARPCRADLTSPELDTDSEAYIETTCFQDGSGEQIGSLLQE